MTLNLPLKSTQTWMENATDAIPATEDIIILRKIYFGRKLIIFGENIFLTNFLENADTLLLGNPIRSCYEQLFFIILISYRLNTKL